MLQQQWFMESPIKTQSLWGNKTHSVHSAFGAAPEQWDLLSSQSLHSCSLWQRISPAWLHGSTRDVFLPAILLSGKGQPFSLQGQPRKRACFPDMWYSFAWNFWHHLLQSSTAASSQALGFGVGLNGKGGMPQLLPGILQHSAFPGLNRSCTSMAGLYSFRKTASVCWSPWAGLGGAGEGCTWDLPELSVLFMAHGLHWAWPRFCQHRCWGWGWLPQLSVSYTKCKTWKSRFWFLAFCCNSRSSASVWLTARVRK